MLIDLFPDGLPKEDPAEWTRIAFKLLEADEQGLHYLVLKRSTLEALQAIIPSTHGQTGVGLLERMKIRKTERNIVLARFKLHVIVEARQGGGISNDVSRQQYRVPWTWFSAPRRGLGTSLCAESETDITFYRRLGSDWLRKNGRPGDRLRTFANPVPLHGGNVKKPLQRSLAEDDATIAIVDSDLHCPDDAIGSTARAANDVGLDRGVALLVADKRWRELENLFPAELVRQFAKEHPAYGERVSDLDAIGAIGPQRAPYWDLKRGVSGRDVMLETDERVRDWRESSLTGLPPKLASMRAQWCERGAATCRSAPAGCSCTLAAGLGDKFADELITWLTEVQPGLNTIVDPVHAELGEKLAAWTLAAHRRNA